MNLNVFFIFLALAISSTVPIHGQTTSDKYQAVINDAHQNGLPAIVALVKAQGEEVWKGKSGLRKLENATPLDIDQSFRLASISKIFTSVVILQLIDEKKIALTDTVSNYLDAVIQKKIPHVNNITIHQLLSHSSGIYSFTENNKFWKECFYNGGMSRVWSPKELIRYIENKKPVHRPVAPNTEKFYSNTNYILLGMIIQKITNNSLSSEYQKRIFTPLNMKHTFLEGYDHQHRNSIDSYAIPNSFFLKSAMRKRGMKKIKGSKLINLSREYKLFNSWAWAAGGISSTVNDLSSFLSALRKGVLLKNDTQKILSKLNSSHNKGITYFGGTGGSDGIQATMLHLMPSDINIIILINSSGHKHVNLSSIFGKLFKIASQK